MPGCSWDGAPHASSSKRQIKRVYDNTPSQIQDVPCFVFFPGGIDPEERSGWTADWHEIRATLVAGDQDWDRAGAILEAYKPLVMAAWKANIQLGGRVTYVKKPKVDPGGFFAYGNKPYLGQDYVFRMRIDDDGPFVS
jgi:hypothetical protein